MIRALYLTMGLMLGFIIGMKASPIHRIWDSALTLAAESARLGCVKAKGSYSKCTKIGQDIYDDLSKIKEFNK